MENLKICFAGVSGSGKTTLAKHFEKELNLPFISGSYTELVEGEQGKTHQQILTETRTSEMVKKEWQLINHRVKNFRVNQKFITDRSLLDSATYGALKLAKDLPKCDIEDLITTCLQLQTSFTSHLIYIPFNIFDYGEWEFEDNGKRIINPWFQLQVGNMMEDIFTYWKTNRVFVGNIDIKDERGMDAGDVYKLNVGKHYLHVLRLTTWDKELRIKTIRKFINDR